MTEPVTTTETGTATFTVTDAAGNVIATRTEETTRTVTTTATDDGTDPDPGPPTSGLLHPGAGYSAAQLDYVGARITQEPYASAWGKVVGKTNDQGGVNNGKKYSDTSWSTSGARAEVGRGSSGSPSEGDDDMYSDGMAALVQALAWRYWGDTPSRDKSAAILNAWSSTCTKVKFDQEVYSDGLLLSGWVGSLFARAGEILRYTGDTPLDVEGLDTFFRNVLWPNVSGQTWGTWRGGGVNWLASMIDAAINMAVYCDDRDMYDKAHGWLDQMIPAWAYMPDDVNKWPGMAGQPISNPWTYLDQASVTPDKMKSYWKNPKRYDKGLWGEMYRDFHHTAMGYGAMANALETAHIQGDDLYGRHGNRILASCELTCGFYYDRIVGGQNPPPGWQGSNPPNYSGSYSNSQVATWEILYNHYAVRKGYGMPRTKQWLDEACRNHSYVVNLHMVGENVTHRDNPA